jgi:hypothetical protein
MDSLDSGFKDALANWEAATKTVFEAMAPDYELYRQQSLAFKSVFMAHLGQTLSSRVTERVHTMPKGTYEENAKLVRWFNEELNLFGLALGCPSTGQPSILHAIPTNKKNPGGGFDIRHKGTGKTSKARVKFSDLLPLEFVEAPQRREGLSEWHDKIRYENISKER